jgi:flagellar hook protein FlgE
MSSFFISLNGLKNAETDLRVIAHNIANSETAGFKKSTAQFADIVARGSSVDPRVSVGLGAAVSSTSQNFSLGSIEQTGRSLDLAINGDGFFTTRNTESDETFFTRNGNFQIDASGNLLDSQEQSVQIFATDASGTVTGTTPIDAVVPTTNGSGSALNNLTITASGILEAAYADGTTEAVGRMALATFPSRDGLQSVGQTQWRATGNSGGAIYGTPSNEGLGSLFSGSLERSNVDLAEEMVALITAQRNFQANARAIDTATTISQTVINLQG